MVMPRDCVEVVANLRFFREHKTGGHFPSAECPDNLVEDLREWLGGEVVSKAMHG